MIKKTAGLGDRIVIAWTMRTSMNFEGLGKGRRMRMTEEDIEYLKAQVPLIAGISGEYSENLIARFGDRQRSVDVSGVSPAYGPMRNMVPAFGGRFVDPSGRQAATARRVRGQRAGRGSVRHPGRGRRDGDDPRLAVPRRRRAPAEGTGLVLLGPRPLQDDHPGVDLPRPHRPEVRQQLHLQGAARRTSTRR